LNPAEQWPSDIRTILEGGELRRVPLGRPAELDPQAFSCHEQIDTLLG
jgi:hypothetical protein